MKKLNHCLPHIPHSFFSLWSYLWYLIQFHSFLDNFTVIYKLLISKFTSLVSVCDRQNGCQCAPTSSWFPSCIFHSTPLKVSHPHSFVKPGKPSGREGEAQVSLTKSAAVNFMYKSIQNYSGLETWWHLNIRGNFSNKRKWYFLWELFSVIEHNIKENHHLKSDSHSYENISHK